MSNTRRYGQNFLYSNIVGFTGFRGKACKVFGTVPGTWKIPLVFHFPLIFPLKAWATAPTFSIIIINYVVNLTTTPPLDFYLDFCGEVDHLRVLCPEP